MKKCFNILVIAFCIISCDKYYFAGMIAPSGADADERFGQSMEYNDAHPIPAIHTNSDDYRVYVMTDCHLEGETQHLDKFVNIFIQDEGTVPFALCLGDLVNGDKPFDTFVSHTAAIQEAGRRMFLTIGNHDLYWGRWKDFRKSFGSSTYRFEVITPSARDIFICIDSGGGTLGTRQREWLEETLKSVCGECRNIVVFTHTHFFMKDMSQGTTSNFPLEESYDLTELFRRYEVNLVLSGHDHHREQMTFKGVEYIIVDALEYGQKDAGYAVLSMGDKNRTEFLPIN